MFIEPVEVKSHDIPENSNQSIELKTEMCSGDLQIHINRRHILNLAKDQWKQLHDFLEEQNKQLVTPLW